MPNWCYNNIEISLCDPWWDLSQKQKQERWDTWMKLRKFCERVEDKEYKDDDENPTKSHGLFQSTLPIDLEGEDWYDQACNTWGTKWDISPNEDVRVEIPDNIYEKITISGKTAWGIPQHWGDHLYGMGFTVTILAEEESGIEIIYHNGDYYDFQKEYLCQDTFDTFVDYCEENNIEINEESILEAYIDCFHKEHIEDIKYDFPIHIADRVIDNLECDYECRIDNDWDEYYSEYNPEEKEKERQDKIKHLEALEECVKRGLISEAEYIQECNELKK